MAATSPTSRAPSCRKTRSFTRWPMEVRSPLPDRWSRDVDDTAGLNPSSRTPRAALRHGRLPFLGPTQVAFGALIALVLVNALFTPNFATPSNLSNVLLQVSTVVIVAVGMTLVIATGGIDLSVGSGMAGGGAGSGTPPHPRVVVAGAP